jgi:hypothetical protein
MRDAIMRDIGVRCRAVLPLLKTLARPRLFIAYYVWLLSALFIFTPAKNALFDGTIRGQSC